MDRTELSNRDADVERICRRFDHLDPALDSETLGDVYRGLLAGQRVGKTDAYGGYRFVSRHADIVAVEKDCKRFSSAGGVLYPPHEGRERSIPVEYDPPEHTAYRKLFMDVLSAQRVKEAEPFLRDLTGQLVGALDKESGGDFTKAVAGQLPIRAVAYLLGWEQAAAEEVQRQATAMLEHMGTELMVKAIDRLHELAKYELDDRRVSPRGDYLTRLTTAEIDGHPLSEAELLNIVQTFIFAGYETTTHAIGNMVLYLAEHPDLQQRLRGDAEARNNVVEESLRLFPPAHTMFRTVTEPTTLGGEALDAGETVALIYGAANRDPEQFDDPETFRVERANVRQHLAFGFGAHFCAGVHLARAEMRILLEVLSEFPRFELAGTPEHLPHLMMGQMMGVEYLPLRFVDDNPAAAP